MRGSPFDATTTHGTFEHTPDGTRVATLLFTFASEVSNGVAVIRIAEFPSAREEESDTFPLLGQLRTNRLHDFWPFCGGATLSPWKSTSRNNSRLRVARVIYASVTFTMNPQRLLALRGARGSLYTVQTKKPGQPSTAYF